MKALWLRADDWLVAAWHVAWVRALAVVLLLTVARDFLAWQSHSAAVLYVQHLISTAWPVLEPVIKAMAGG